MRFFSIYADERFWCWYFLLRSECTFYICMLIWCTNFQSVSVIPFNATSLIVNWFMIFNPYGIAVDMQETYAKATYRSKIIIRIDEKDANFPPFPYHHVARYYEKPSSDFCPFPWDSHSFIQTLRCMFLVPLELCLLLQIYF